MSTKFYNTASWDKHLQIGLIVKLMLICVPVLVVFYFLCIMQKITPVIVAFFLSISSISCDDIVINPDELGLSHEEVVEGLRVALSIGTDTSVRTLSSVDGYLADAAVKILLPAEAEVIEKNISKVPGGNLLIENAIKAINRAAEDAAVEAKPIFLQAIKDITIENGFAILNGSDDAATNHLRTQTESELIAAFTPKISASLNKKLLGNVSAESTYKALIDAYNKASLNGFLFPMVQSNSLTQHTTEKAMNGLFLKVADEEQKIRTDVNHRVNDLLKKIFAEE